jgi:hypothetical protein
MSHRHWCPCRPWLTPVINDQEDEMRETIDPVVDLVVNAIGYGVMMALEGRSELLAKLQALPATSTLADALVSDAEGFIRTRRDLVEALADRPVVR